MTTLQQQADKLAHALKELSRQHPVGLFITFGVTLNNKTIQIQIAWSRIKASTELQISHEIQTLAQEVLDAEV